MSIYILKANLDHFVQTLLFLFMYIKYLSTKISKYAVQCASTLQLSGKHLPVYDQVLLHSEQTRWDTHTHTHICSYFVISRS